MKNLLIASVAFLAFASCAKGDGKANAQMPAASTTAAAQTLPEGHPDIEAPSAPAAAGANAITGKVLETMNSGGYTYVKVGGPSGEVWAAVPESKVQVGQTVTLNAQMTMDDFESKTLNRKFDHIIFGSLAGQPKAGGGMMGAAMGTPSERMAGPADSEKISVPKVEGGQQVADLWASKAALKDKPVMVRGKVVKSLDSIMGKNWIHIRDGSGARDKGTDDITVTTSDTAKVGDIVVVRGTLRTDKDFGAGYVYPVIIEDAKISK